MIKQDNVVIYPLPWCPLNFEPDKNSNGMKQNPECLSADRKWIHSICMHLVHASCACITV